MTYNKEMIRAKLETSDRWLVRGLLAVYDNQTTEEQIVEGVVVDNGVGFNGVDGEILTKMAKWYKAKGYLSPKQTALVRRKMLKYAGQLAKLANEKQANKAAVPAGCVEPLPVSLRAGESGWRRPLGPDPLEKMKEALSNEYASSDSAFKFDR